MSKQLRMILSRLKDAAHLRAFMAGRNSIAGDLAFPSETGTPISPDNIVPRTWSRHLNKPGFAVSDSTI